MKKKGMVVATLAIALCVAWLVAACAVEKENPTVKKKGGDSQTGGVAKVGDTLTLKGTSYKVTKVKTAPSVGGAFMKQKADGIFVLVSLTLTNKESKPATIAEDGVRIKGGNGAEYTVSTEGSLAVDNALLILEEIQPDSPKKVVGVYDIPKKAVKGAQLVVKDFWSESTGTIDLGL